MSVYGLSGTANAGHRTTAKQRDNRQHAWNDYLTETDSRGLAVPPRHRLLLLMDYQGSGTPTEADRLEVEETLRQLENAFEWSSDGLLFTISYAPSYFDRWEGSLPSGIDLTGLGNAGLQDLIDAIAVEGEDPTPEPREVHMHLASHNAANLLAAEEAIFGNRSFLNGVAFDATFEGIFTEPTSFPDRRTGFVGGGEPADQIDNDDIPADAPLSMGFQSGFTDNLPSEDNVSMVWDQTFGQPMPPGVFAQGTTEQVSKLTIDLQSWYDQPKEDRTAKMYSPQHVGHVGEIGNALGTTSDTPDKPMLDISQETDIARETEKDAKNLGLVGHQQKLARTRFDLGARRESSDGDGVEDTTILRRDFDTTDGGGPGLHFVTITRFMTYMDYVRNSMNKIGITHPFSDGSQLQHEEVDVPIENHGFLDFITATRRGVFLVPPIAIRALPPASAFEPTIDVEPQGPEEVITLSESTTSVALINTQSGSDQFPYVFFGEPEQTMRLQSAEPFAVDQFDVDGDGDIDTVFHFDTADLGLTTDDDTVRFLMYSDGRDPVLKEKSVTVEA